MTDVTETQVVSDHEPGGARVAVLGRLNRPAAGGLIAFVCASAIALGRWRTFARENISAFILVGRHFVTQPGQLPPGLKLQPDLGYDGQFYYRLALNPANLHSTAFGITVDTPYRFIRDGYPFLAWLLAAGQHHLVPETLVAVNILAIAAIAVLGGVFARDSGRHALWGLLLAGFYGLVTTLSRDTAEAVASAFLLAGLLALRARPARSQTEPKSRPVLAGVLLGYGALSRETVIIAPVAYAAVRIVGIALRRYRPGRADFGWIIPAVMFGGWQVVVYAATGQWALLADSGANANTPFAAPLHAIKWNFTHLDAVTLNSVDEWALEFIVFAFVVICAIASLRSTKAPLYERIAFIVYIFEICLVAPTTWNSLTADMRSFIEVWLLGILILFGNRRRPWTSPLAYRLPAIAAMLTPVLLVVITRRMTGT